MVALNKPLLFFCLFALSLNRIILPRPGPNRITQKFYVMREAYRALQRKQIQTFQWEFQKSISTKSTSLKTRLIIKIRSVQIMDSLAY